MALQTHNIHWDGLLQALQWIGGAEPLVCFRRSVPVRLASDNFTPLLYMILFTHMGG
jgi:hypothetical protein